MRKKLTVLALTATSIAGGGAALVGPGLAFAQDSTSAAATADATADRAAARTAALRTALSGLVANGTLMQVQVQADAVATTLSAADLGHGRRGMKAGRASIEATAEVLGITVEELRTARDAGQTLAQIATAEGVSRDDLISGLVAAAQAQRTEAVEAGTITQARADELAAGLQERITEKVDDVHTGRGNHSRDTDDDANTTGTPAPTASATA